ncbi:hypothetical protein ETI06_13100 [Macrococcoides goetzii]|nr:hypothetical protein [Macrococcus goetzii]TDM38815.1 hypothetical protein ETI10_13300 [Macrococcus goetzii]TDM45101.1 hypothetical protein ETI06_13100 [Macrococcus goetzii]
MDNPHQRFIDKMKNSTNPKYLSLSSDFGKIKQAKEQFTMLVSKETAEENEIELTRLAWEYFTFSEKRRRN